MTDAEPLVPEPSGDPPRLTERKLPLCPTCRCLMRRDLSSLTSHEAAYGPWRCDLHGEADPVWEVELLPTHDEEDQ